MEVITLTESQELIACEAKIKTGIKSFYDVGIALVTIRDKRLFRSTHASFDDYCKNVWGWGQKRASQFIVAAKTVDSLPDSTNVETESQARELAKVTADKREEVLVNAGKNPTAKAIREAAQASTAVASEPTEPTEPPMVESYRPEPALKGVDLAKLDTLPPNEQRVTYWYLMLENFMHEAFTRAADKQLISMSVLAALIPKMIKAEIARRNKKTA